MRGVVPSRARAVRHAYSSVMHVSIRRVCMGINAILPCSCMHVLCLRPAGRPAYIIIYRVVRISVRSLYVLRYQDRSPQRVRVAYGLPLSHRIFRRMHEVLNIDENNN